VNGSSASGCAPSHKTVKMAVKEGKQKEPTRNMLARRHLGVSPKLTALPANSFIGAVLPLGCWLLAARISAPHRRPPPSGISPLREYNQPSILFGPLLMPYLNTTGETDMQMSMGRIIVCGNEQP
jgi:hypothetical protein